MSTAMFMEYPEFILAAVAGIIFLLFGKSQPGFAMPGWMTAPAVGALSFLPQKYLGSLVEKLTWAGWRSNTAFGALAACKVALPIICLLSNLLGLPLYATLLMALVAFFAPDFVISQQSRRRQQKIRETLPQALDLMVLCVDAGLGLDATLQRIAAERTHVAQALNEELSILGRDVLLGMERERAYKELYNRTGVEELKALGSSLNQSAKLGISIAKILRAQADFLRMKLGQKAEEKAAKLPIYMSFPLWFCIMPALMVILLAPSMITFMQKAPSSKADFFK